MTICTHEREALFGAVVDGVMRLNARGRLVGQVWVRTANCGHAAPKFDLVVMPNHIHGIIWLNGASVGARRPPVRNAIPATFDLSERGVVPILVDASPLPRHESARPVGYAAESTAARVAAFKSQSAHAINRLRGTPGAPVWQRNYYERVVRNEDELMRIRQYVLDNPARWPDDPNNVS